MCKRGRIVSPAALAAIAAAALAACAPSRQDRAAVEIRGTDPAGGTAAASVPAPAPVPTTEGGIVSYGSYRAAVAREGETVAMLADRVGLSASQLAAYNGLTPAHRLQEGDELVLPPKPDGADAPGSTGSALTATPQAGTIEQAPLPGAGAGTDADGNWSPALAAAAIERSTGLNPDGTLGAPPSSTEPVPPEPEPRRELRSPDLEQYQTPAPRAEGQTDDATDMQSGTDVAAVAPAAPALRLTRPVEGPVAIGFNKGAGAARNDGVDFAAAAGSPVVAAADGEVALVSQSLGGLGTIVLLRHQDEILTVYGRIDDVSVSKGDMVRRGQQIGVVSDAAAPAEPRMHFEVRRGAESLDPMRFL